MNWNAYHSTAVRAAIFQTQRSLRRVDDNAVADAVADTWAELKDLPPEQLSERRVAHAARKHARLALRRDERYYRLLATGVEQAASPSVDPDRPSCDPSGSIDEVLAGLTDEQRAYAELYLTGVPPHAIHALLELTENDVKVLRLTLRRQLRHRSMIRRGP